jgi:hypothetical protein
MTRKTSEGPEPISLREKWLVLAMVNTLQPVKPALLLQGLSKDFDGPKFDRVLDILRREEMLLPLDNGEYVVTHKGQEAFGSSPLARARDISRMFRLVERSKGGGAKA